MQDIEEFQLLVDIVERTREKLAVAIDHDARKWPEFDREGLRATFNGYCGMAQCIAGYHMQDNFDAGALTVRPVATQSLEGFWYGHAFLSIEVREESGSRLYIVDPTFAQFREPEAGGPLDVLNESSAGGLVADDLLRFGVARLSPETALLLARGFCRGSSPFKSGDDAFRFFQNPPSHPYHFRHSPDNDRFSREALGASGYLLAPI